MKNVNIPNIIAAPNWAAILSAAQGSGSTLDLPALKTTLTASAPPDDFAELGHIFKVESTKPEYKLNLRMLPKQILQMAYLKLFIPLSLLTTLALDKIQFNDRLKYQKIIFSSNAGKHMLNILIFPDEMSLSEMEFWQAYCNWLMLIDLIADSIMANSWHEHHTHMMANKSFSLCFPAWREHDHLLWAKFMIDPFMVNPNHSSYVHQFEHCRGNQTCNDTIAVASSSKKEPFSHQACNTNAMSYNKNAPQYSSFWTSLCICCGTSGHM